MGLILLLLVISISFISLASASFATDRECRRFGFDQSVARWRCGNILGWRPTIEGDGGTLVNGTCSDAFWDAQASGADGIVVREKLLSSYSLNGTSGDLEQLRSDLNRITFCVYDKELSCKHDYNCGNISSGLECDGRSNIILNVTTTPFCSKGECMFNETSEFYDACAYGCFEGHCTPDSCGNGSVEEWEQCDDGNDVNGDGCNHKCVIEPTTCDHECFTPNSLNDNTKENITTHPGEDNLQEFLDSHGYSINATKDQTNTQLWHASDDVVLEITFIGGQAVERHAFGYYLNSDSSTFVPIFEDSDNPLYNKPIANEGDTFTVTINGSNTVGFAIDSWNGTSTTRMHLTENLLNFDFKDRVLVYDLCDEFILAFENTYSDFDYQDLVVSVKLISCGSQTFCGNEVVEEFEQCDDGNQNNYDSCRNDCTLPICGDGTVDGNEQCDDGNTNNGDGCNHKCVIEKECIDADKDEVCDNVDECPDSLPGEEVDEDGCDIFQFCSGRICGPDCSSADWLDNEEEDPRDCKVILPLSNGIIQSPRCVPTISSDMCAG